MSLVVQLKDVETGTVAGRADPAEGGWRLVETMRIDDFEGAGPLGTNARWRDWEGRKVEVLVAHTEGHPSGIRWFSWLLSVDLAEELFGRLEG